MNKFIIIIILAWSQCCIAQSSYSTLEFNNVAARVNTHGRWFNDLVNFNAYVVPKNEGVSSIFSTSFIMGGMDANNNLKLAGTIYGNGQDYFVGPIADNSSSVDFNMRYDRLWKVSNIEILQHQASYSEPGYIMPESIASWPGNGNTANGESHILAPFVDLNADGIYNPNEGDYPQIKGDQAVYFIMNDYNGLHTETGGARVGVEIHAMTYAFSAAVDSPINDCVFINLQVRKKVGGNLSNFYLGIYNDFDLGAYNNDYIGTDSIRNMVYVYNGEFEDHPVTGSTGYGNHIPSQGCMFLNQPMAKSVYWNLMGFGHPNSQDPTTAEHFYNYLRGLWNNGTQIMFPYLKVG